MEKQNDYSKMSLIIIFLIFSHIGWLWEMSISSHSFGIFVNRGFMHGPWLPVYGTGAILIILLIGRKRMSGWRVFLGSAALCGILEYFTSWLLERLFHAKWWDYSQEFLNLNGRTCLTAVLLFGIAGNLILNFAAPFLNSRIDKMDCRKRKLVCTVFGIIFLADYIISLFHPNKGLGVIF